MQQYGASVQVQAEFNSQYDGIGGSSKHDAQFECRFKVREIEIQASMKNGKGEFRVNNYFAKDENAAYEEIASLLQTVSQILSYEIQRVDSNAHWGHTRLAWHRADLRILTRDSAITDRMDMTVTQLVKPERLEEKIASCLSHKEKSFILSCLYNATGPYDYRSKFYNAFTIMEYLESNYSETITVTRMYDDDKLEEIGVIINGGLSTWDEALRNVAITSTKETLKKKSVESRAMKLAAILNDSFKIPSIAHISGEILIDIKKVKDFIATRNALFHGSSMNGGQEGDLKLNTEHLIAVSTQVVDRLLSKE
jgi:hypothetical protein